MPYNTAPQLTMSNLNSGIDVYNSANVNFQFPQNSANTFPTGNQWGYSAYSGQQSSNYGASSGMGQSSQTCFGVQCDSMGNCLDCGYLEVVGQYTHINLMKLPQGRLNSVEIYARNQGSIMLQLWRYDQMSNKFMVFYEKIVELRDNPRRNVISVEVELNRDDMIGFSHLGSGVVPIQYTTKQGVRSYEDSVGRSGVIGNTEIDVPQGFSSKQFNMKACVTTCKDNLIIDFGSKKNTRNYFLVYFFFYSQIKLLYSA